MKLKQVLSEILILSILLSFFSFARAEEKTFSVTSCTPQNRATEVSPVDLKMVLTFSEDLNLSTVNSSTVETSESVIAGYALENARTLNIYFSKGALSLGTTYTVKLKEGIRSIDGAALVPYQTTFKLTEDAPHYYQITNGDFNDTKNGYVFFDGNANKTLSFVTEDGRTAIKVRPEWGNGVIGQQVICEPGTSYTARAVVKTSVDETVQLQNCFYTEDNRNDPYHYGPREMIKAGEWTTIEANFSIPENVDGSVDIRIAFSKEYQDAYVDFFQFYEVGNDMEEPKTDASGAGGVTYVNPGKDVMTKITAFGLIPEGVEETSVVTRIDLAKMMLYAAGVKEIPYSSKQIFSDCSGDAQNVANAAFQNGLMNGIGDGLFAPAQSATIAETVTVLLSAMGWDTAAKQRGGYPAGYVATAGDLGMLRELSGKIYEPITYGDLARLLDNTLDCDVLSVSFGENNRPALNREKSFLSVCLGLEEGSGIIDGIPETYLESSKTPSMSGITIDGKEYQCYADMKDYLGYKVKFYYKENDGTDEDELVYIYGMDSLNQVAEFSTSEGDVSYAAGRYTAPGSGTRSVTYRLSDQKNVIYNGKYLGSYFETEETFVPVDGSVKLIDNGDGYKTVCITSIQTILVGNVDQEQERIYDSRTNAMIDLKDADSVSIKDKNGKNFKLKSIRKNNVLSVIASMDQKYFEIAVSQDKLSGIVSGISEDDGVNYIVIGDNQYGSVVSMRYPTVPGYFDVKKMASGMQGSFYLDAQGRIAGFETQTVSENVGYLINAFCDTNDSGEDALWIKVFDQNNKFQTYECVEKVKIDVTRTKSAERAIELLKKGTDDVVSQLILYKIDPNGKVTIIDTAYNKMPGTSNYKMIQPDSREDKEGLRISYSSIMLPDGSPQSPQVATFNTNSMSFNYRVQLSGNPTIFIVPLDAKNDQRVKFQVTNNYWMLGNMYSSYIESYLAGGNSFVTDYLVVYLDGSQYLTDMMNGDRFGIVKKITQCVENDEAVNKIEFVSGAVIYADISYDFSGFGPGDYISYRQDKDGYIWQAAKLLYDASENKLNVSNSGFNDNSSSVNVVNVYNKKGSIIQAVNFGSVMADPNVLNDAYIMDLSRATILKYNKSTNKVENAMQADIMDYTNSGSDYSSLLLISESSVVKTALILGK